MSNNAPASAHEPVIVGSVQTIFRFPIKSVGGRALTHAYVGAEGVLGDHQFAFYDLETGNICNAKYPRKFASMLACHAEYVEEPSPGAELPLLRVTFPDGAAHTNEGDALDRAMSTHLGREVKLISSVPEGTHNEIAYPRASGMARESVYAAAVRNKHGDEVAVYPQRPGTSFYDLTPLHLVTTSTIAHFRKINPDAAFDARRYRPNFVIDTPAEGLVEGTWVGRQIRLGSEAIADILMPAPRCVMSTLEHAPDVPLDRATLRTVVKHNTQEVPGLKGRWGCAGVYSNVGGWGQVAVGDEVTLLP